MNHSEQLNELAAALVKAQAEIKGAAKDSLNPFFRSSYADLSSVWEACRDALGRYGLSVVQMPSFRMDGEVAIVGVTTMLLHQSGQWVSELGETPVPPCTNKAGEFVAKADPQITGSAITYLRRYGLASFVGVTPEDDDGESVAQGAREAQAQTSRGAKKPAVLPGKPTSWDGWGGKPLTDVPSNVLTSARKWLQDKDAKSPAPSNTAIIDAIDDVLESRRDMDGELP